MSKRFGIEIEFTGATRSTVVKAMEDFFQTTAKPFESAILDNPYTYHKIEDFAGSQWRVVRDRSIRSEFYPQNKPSDLKVKDLKITPDGLIVHDIDDYKVELVSPVLTAESLPTLFSLLDLLKSLGCCVNDTTGIHIHIDAPESANDLISLLQRFSQDQENIIEHFKSDVYRVDNYCKVFPEYAVKTFLAFSSGNPSLEYKDILDLYLTQLRVGATPERPHPERYYALNLSSLTMHNTVEFRFFNSTLEANEVADMLEWVLDFSYGSDIVSVVS